MSEKERDLRRNDYDPPDPEDEQWEDDKAEWDMDNSSWPAGMDDYFEIDEED